MVLLSKNHGVQAVEELMVGISLRSGFEVFSGICLMAQEIQTKQSK